MISDKISYMMSSFCAKPSDDPHESQRPYSNSKWPCNYLSGFCPSSPPSFCPSHSGLLAFPLAGTLLLLNICLAHSWVFVKSFLKSHPSEASIDPFFFFLHFLLQSFLPQYPCNITHIESNIPQNSLVHFLFIVCWHISFSGMGISVSFVNYLKHVEHTVGVQ